MTWYKAINSPPYIEYIPDDVVKEANMIDPDSQGGAAWHGDVPWWYKEMDEEVLQSFQTLLSYNPQTGSIIWRVDVNRKTIKKGTEAGSVKHNGYRVVHIKKNYYKLHRIAWFLYHGEWPVGEIDHINGIRDDNRIANLRVVSSRQNGQNRTEQRNGKLVGTVKDKRCRRKPWYAQVVYKGKRIHSRYFSTEAEAHEAYLVIIKELGNEESLGGRYL